MSEENGGSKPSVTMVSSDPWAKTLATEFRGAGYPVVHIAASKVEQTEGGLLLVPDSMADALSQDLQGRVVVFRIVPQDAGDQRADAGRNYIREQTATKKALETIERAVFGNRSHDRFFIRLSARLKSPDRSYRGRTIDLSLGGAAIIIPARTKPVEGEKLTLKLDYGLGGPTMNCTGTVQWLRDQRSFIFKKIVIGLKFELESREDEFSKFIADCHEFAVQTQGMSNVGQRF